MVHCPCLLISFTMVFVPKCTVFSKAVQIPWSSYIYFYKAVQPLKSCTTKEKKLYIFGTLSLPVNFIHNGVCTKMYSFFKSCTNSVVLIYICLKSCTTIKKLYNQRKKLYNQRKKLYNQRKKLYIFGTLSLPLNFIHNVVCTKMYSFFLSCTNSVVLI